MQKTGRVYTVLSVLTFLISIVIVQPAPVNAQTNTIIVPDDYPTIQSAIGNASAGDTVFVRSGEYESSLEGLKITKPLTLLGESSQSTVLKLFPQPQGNSFDWSIGVLEVLANNVTISGFTLQGRSEGSVGLVYSVCGITVQTSNVTIANNTITNMGCGISIPRCYNITIANNSILDNGASFEQKLPFFGGIYIESSSVTIQGNNIIGNIWFGMTFNGRSNCTIYNNNIIRNDVGIYLQNYPPTSEGSGDIYYNNFIDNNQSVSNPDNIGQNLSWDNGKVGNYWSDYNGNGFYVIDEKNVDNYPLTQQVDINSIAPTPTPTSTILSLVSEPIILAILIVAPLLAIIVSILLYKSHRKTANLK